MFVYKMDRSINEWCGWIRAEEAFRIPEHCPDLFTANGTGGDYAERLRASARWEHLWISAQVIAREVGWEGDLLAGPFAMQLPWDDSDHGPCFVIGWNSEDSGAFIASPVELPWLGQYPATDGNDHTYTMSCLFDLRTKPDATVPMADPESIPEQVMDDPEHVTKFAA